MCVYIYIHTCLRVCMRVYACVRMQACMYVRICTVAGAREVRAPSTVRLHWCSNPLPASASHRGTCKFLKQCHNVHNNHFRYSTWDIKTVHPDASTQIWRSRTLYLSVMAFRELVVLTFPGGLQIDRILTTTKASETPKR